jgi:hypothetical protein
MLGAQAARGVASTSNSESNEPGRPEKNVALNITCPDCKAAFALSDDARYKKAFCPRCGISLLITASGVAKRIDSPRPAPEPTEDTPGRDNRWLFFATPLCLLAVGLWIAVATRGNTDSQPQQVAKTDTQPPPEPAPREAPISLPPTTSKEPDKATTTPVTPKKPDKTTTVPATPKEPAKTSESLQLPLDALGTPERLSQVRGVRLEMKYTDAKNSPNTQMPLTWTWFSPDQWRIDMANIAIAINGKEGWVNAVTEKKPLAEAFVTHARDMAGWIGVGLVRPLANEKYQLTVLGPAMVKGRPTTCVKVNVEGSSEIKLYFDSDTRLLAKAEYDGPDLSPYINAPAGPNKHLEIYFSDYRETDQIKQWHKMEYSDGNGAAGSFEVTSVRFLNEVDEKLLTQP